MTRLGDAHLVGEGTVGGDGVGGEQFLSLSGDDRHALACARAGEAPQARDANGELIIKHPLSNQSGSRFGISKRGLTRLPLASCPSRHAAAQTWLELTA